MIPKVRYRNEVLTKKNRIRSTYKRKKNPKEEKSQSRSSRRSIYKKEIQSPLKLKRSVLQKKNPKIQIQNEATYKRNSKFQSPGRVKEPKKKKKNPGRMS